MAWKVAALGVCVVMAASLPVRQAEASRSDWRGEVRMSQPRAAAPATRPATQRSAAARSDWGGISCVPYARSVTGMEVSGNGRDWWHNAAGRYARGQRPERGSVLAFPGSGGMRSGHVAVVARVHHARLIEIDHANWGGPGIRRGTVMRGVKVVDVSEDNSWTRVRVQVGWDSSNFGREYPTYGFIHNRPAGAFAAGEDMVRPVSYSRREAARPAARPAARTTQAQPARNQPARTATVRTAAAR
jgi:hypothetical protein